MPGPDLDTIVSTSTQIGGVSSGLFQSVGRRSVSGWDRWQISNLTTNRLSSPICRSLGQRTNSRPNLNISELHLASQRGADTDSTHSLCVHYDPAALLFNLGFCWVI